MAYFLDSYRGNFLGIFSPVNYGDLAPDALLRCLTAEWGFLLEEDRCPVWVSEFGAHPTDDYERRFLSNMVAILEKLDADWAYWPLNARPRLRGRRRGNKRFCADDLDAIVKFVEVTEATN